MAKRSHAKVPQNRPLLQRQLLRKALWKLLKRPTALRKPLWKLLKRPKLPKKAQNWTLEKKLKKKMLKLNESLMR